MSLPSMAVLHQMIPLDLNHVSVSYSTAIHSISVLAMKAGQQACGQESRVDILHDTRREVNICSTVQVSKFILLPEEGRGAFS